MRYREFKKEARTDEILPAIAGGVAKVGAGIAKAGAKAVGGAVAKVGAKAVKAVGSAGKSMATKVAGAAADKLSQELIKRGSKIPMPTEKGAKEFEIDDVNGDEVTLVNPDASKAPEEPLRRPFGGSSPSHLHTFGSIHRTIWRQDLFKHTRTRTPLLPPPPPHPPKGKR